MKKKLILLLGIMIIVVVAGFMLTKYNNQKSNEENKEHTIQIVTSFYPMYVVALNIADQIPNMEVKNLTGNNTGCLHDYQLTTEDMKLLSNADVFIMNGGGIESFIEEVTKEYPDLYIINASEGVTMLEEQEHEEENIAESTDDNEEEHDHGEYNPHIWLNPKLYVNQIENVQNGLIQYINKLSTNIEDTDQVNNNEEDIELTNIEGTDINGTNIKETDNDKINYNEIINKIGINAQAYIQKVLELDQEIEGNNFASNNEGVVIFHDAFAYLADRIGLSVVHTVEMDSETVLSAGDIATVIDEVKENNIRLLFTEEQYSDSIATRIEEETDAVVYIIDSGVTGDGTKDSYLVSMRYNLLVLKGALQ